jgi:hypothetical protein
MLIAKLALGLGGTMVLAGAYTFHEGIIRVDERHIDGKHIQVWIPAAIVPMALHFVPRHHLERAAREAGPWMPTLRALTKELEKYPEAQLVEVQAPDAHFSVRTHGGKLLIDVSAPEDEVHVACPLAMMEHVERELEANTPSS